MKLNNKHFAYVLIISCILIFMYGLLFSKNENTKINIDNCYTLSNKWNINNDKLIDLPYKVDGKENEKVVLKNTLPEFIDDNYSISLLSNYCINEIYIEDELIYSYGAVKPLQFGNMTGNIRCIIDLNKEYAGKEITWVITPYYTQTMELPVLAIDITEKIEFKIFLKNLWKIIVVTIFTLLSLIVFGFVGYRISKHLEYNNKLLAAYASFMLALSIWIICSSDIPQFITNNNQMVSFTSFLSIAFMATIYCSLNQYLLKDFEKTFKKLKTVSLINIVVQLISFVTNFKDPIEYLLLTHAIILTILGFAIFATIKTLKYNTLKIMLIGDSIFIISIILALGSFYTHPGNGNDALYLTIGFFTLITSYFSIIIKNEVLEMKKVASLKIYKDLAFKDSLTGLKNRAAYDDDIDKLILDDNIKNVSLIICDLNYLKSTNDNYGHEKGDLLIKSAANCIYDSFKETGTSYRLGGDEFLVLLTNKKDSANIYLKKFDENLIKYNESNDLKLSIAYGYIDIDLNTLNKDQQIKEAFRKADAYMYKMKIRQHKKMS